MSFSGEQISAIIIKYINEQELTADETIQLEEFLASDDNRILFDTLIDKNNSGKQAKELSAAREEIWNKITSDVEYNNVKPIRSGRFRTKAIAITAVLLLIAGSIYIWMDHSSANTSMAGDNSIGLLTPADILPAINKTILTLSNGKTVIIDPSSKAVVTAETDGSATLQDNGLVYQPVNNSKDLSAIYNTVTTSRGGKQCIILSDGTIVWLNASSSIRYPVAFSGAQRKVSIKGEVYFEVAPQSSKAPFIVDVDGRSEVTVLGTHFNVNSYDDEENIKVTLLEGKVKVAPAVNSQVISQNAQFLFPGQQAVVKGNNKPKIVKGVDINYVMAWKNGEFIFKSADIETILREASRWYDIEVVYEQKPADRFSGKINRKVNLGQLLDILKESEVLFKLEKNRKLIIYERK